MNSEVLKLAGPAKEEVDYYEIQRRQDHRGKWKIMFRMDLPHLGIGITLLEFFRAQRMDLVYRIVHVKETTKRKALEL